MRRVVVVCLVAAVVLCRAGAAVHACRVVRPRPVKEVPAIARVQQVVTRTHTVNIEVTEQAATVNLKAVFYNPNEYAVSGTYFFPLPDEVAVSKFKIRIGDREIEGKLMEKQEARRLFMEAARENKQPALLEYVGWRILQCAVANIAPKSEVTVRLSYTQELRYSGGLTELVYPLASARNIDGTPIKTASVTVHIKSEAPIRGVYSPGYRIAVRQSSDNEVTASYEGSHINPQKDFRLFIRRSTEDIGLIVLTHRPEKEKPGYFMAMFTPKLNWGEKVVPKDIIFVLDVSGSMREGAKIKQAKKALEFCVRSLNKVDRFNIITFNNEAARYKDALIRADKENVRRAADYIKQISIGGGTNIHAALMMALNTFKDDDRLHMIAFFTDGLPTVGKRDVKAIVEDVTGGNKADVRLFVWGVGYNVNTVLLDRLAEENHGAREYVKGEDIEVKVSEFYKKIASPVLTDIKAEYGFETEDVYPRALRDLFSGTQLVLFGRYKQAGSFTIKLSGKTAGEVKTYEYEVEMPEESAKNDFVPRLWAKRKIGFLLDRIRLGGLKPEARKELKESVIELSKRYGIQTPYTSFLAEENTELARLARRARGAADKGGWARGGKNAPAPRPQGAREPKSGDRPAPHAAPAAPMKPAPPTGRGAVEASKKLKEMRKAESLAGEAEGKEDADGYGGGGAVRRVGLKTFYFVDGVWIDARYDEKKFKEKTTIVRFMSEEYMKLIDKHRDLIRCLELGEEVIVVLEGVAYHFVPEDWKPRPKKVTAPEPGKGAGPKEAPQK